MATENTTARSGRTSLWRKRSLVGLGVVLVLGVVVFLALRPAPETPRSAPVFTLPLLGETGELSNSELEGKPVVFNFWASWCEPCKEELPAFQAIAEQYGDRVTIVGVNVQDTEDEAIAMAERFELTYPLVVGDRAIQRDFDIFGLPQTFFVTSDYELMRSEIQPDEGPTLLGEDNGSTSGLGAITRRELEGEIEKLLDD